MYNFSMLIDDSIFKSFEEKIKIFNKFLINNVEINDYIDGKNITELNGCEIEKIRNLLIQYNKKIVLLNCSTDINDYEYYKTAFRNAHMLGVENIKIGFCLNCDSCSDSNNNKNHKNSFHEMLADNLKKIIRLGESYGIGVLIENNSALNFTHDVEFTRICKDFELNNIYLIFNPLEYVRLKEHPFFHIFYNSKLKNNILFLRVNDGLYIDGSPTLPGEGNGEIKEMTSAILARGFKGYFSFTPYLNTSIDSNIFIKTYENIISKFKSMLMEM